MKLVLMIAGGILLAALLMPLLGPLSWILLGGVVICLLVFFVIMVANGVRETSGVIGDIIKYAKRDSKGFRKYLLSYIFIFVPSIVFFFICFTHESDGNYFLLGMGWLMLSGAIIIPLLFAYENDKKKAKQDENATRQNAQQFFTECKANNITSSNFDLPENQVLIRLLIKKNHMPGNAEQLKELLDKMYAAKSKQKK